MTIGIGFKCHDGLVLATDTQYTRGGYKSHGPKLFELFAPVQLPNLSVMIAGAGAVSYMKMAVAKLEERLRGVKDPGIVDVKNVIENTLLDFFQKHIYPIPSHKQDAALFEMILGVWTSRDRFAILQTQGTSVTQEMTHGSGHCCIGSGIPLSVFALDLTYPPGGVSVEHAKFLAALSIKAAKDYVGSCGGKTRIYTLKANGSGFRVHHVMAAEVEDAERYSEELFDTLKYVLVCLDTESFAFDEGSVRGMTDLLKDGIVGFIKKQTERKERIRKFREKAEKPTQPSP